MSRPPSWLAALPQDLDLRDARGQPTGLARQLFVTLLAHSKRGVAFPGTARLAILASAEEPRIRAGLRLLENRRAILRDGRVWQIRLTDGPTQVGPQAPCRVFWPGNDPTAFQALWPALRNRNQVAAVMMIYQFARPPEHSSLAACPPNHAWIARVLGTSVDTVYRAKREVITRGLATEHTNGLLVFEDPARWPEILNVVQPAPLERGSALVGLTLVEPSAGAGEPLALVSTGQAANVNMYPPRDPIADVERAITLAGWTLPPDPLAHEIIAKGVDTWGAAATIARLQAALAGPYPSYALEPLGAELGEEFECPYQLIRCG